MNVLLCSKRGNVPKNLNEVLTRHLILSSNWAMEQPNYALLNQEKLFNSGQMQLRLFVIIAGCFAGHLIAPLWASNEPNASFEFKASDIPDFSLGGYLIYGISGKYTGGRVKADTEVKLDIETKRKKGIKTNIELSADQNSRSIELDDAFVDYRLSKKSPWSLRFGRGRRKIGFENEDSRRKRLSLYRTPIYSELSVYNWLARDNFFRLRYKKEKRSYSIASHLSDSKDILLLGSLNQPLSKSFHFASWASFMSLKRTGLSYHVYLLGMGVKYAGSAWRAELEAFVGSNPIYISVEEDNSLYLGACRFGLSRNFGSWRPFLQMTAFRPLIDEALGESYSGIFGIEYSFNKRLNVILENNTTFTRSEIDEDVTTWRNGSVNLQARYFF